MPTSPSITIPTPTPTPIRSLLACAVCGSQHLTPSSLRCRSFSDTVPGVVEIDDRGVSQDPDDGLSPSPLIQLDLVCEHGHVTWFSWHTQSEATVAEQGVIDYQASRATLPALSPEEKLLRAVFHYESEQGDEDDANDGDFKCALNRCMIRILSARPDNCLCLMELWIEIDSVMATLFTQDRYVRVALRTWLSLTHEKAFAAIEATCDHFVRRGLIRRGETPHTFGMDASQAARARTLEEFDS